MKKLLVCFLLIVSLCVAALCSCTGQVTPDRDNGEEDTPENGGAQIPETPEEPGEKGDQGEKIAVVRYGSYMLDAGEANYFASYYKHLFLTSLNDAGVFATDVQPFWESKAEDGRRYSEVLSESFKEYISGLLISNALFDRYSELEKTDKEKIKQLAEDKLNKYGGEAAFNRASSKYGFDYDDYKTCVEYLYKASMAQAVIFGENGENLTSFPAECEEYYKDNYSRVKLLFLRDKDIIYIDGNGEQQTRPLTDSEKAEREEAVYALSEAIKNKANNSSGPRINSDMFKYYYEKSDSEQKMFETGYYFAENAELTTAFAEEFPEIVEKSLSMKVGEYAEVKCSVGTCFIYKDSLVANAFTNKDNIYFSDFYTDALYSVYSKMLASYAEDVVFEEQFEDIDIIDIPRNYEFIIFIIRHL